MTSAILGAHGSMSVFLTVETQREGMSTGPIPCQTPDRIRWRHTGSITARGRRPIDTGNRDRRVVDCRDDTLPPGLFPQPLRTRSIHKVQGNPLLCSCVLPI